MDPNTLNSELQNNVATSTMAQNEETVANAQNLSMAQPQVSPQSAINQQQSSMNDNLSQTIMPTKNKYSIISYYLGFVGLLPFIGFPFAIAAIYYGIKAMNLYKQNPTPGAKGHALTGIILGSIATFFGVLFGLFVIIGLATSSSSSSNY